jgi:D-glycero-D-manno-heptose 1,7-bisphosphate phosphatase
MLHSPVLILGRDGVINEVREPAVLSAEDWVPLPGALKAIARATQAGFRVAVTTNQPGLAEGLLDIHALNRIHNKMFADLAKFGGIVEAIFFCPHGRGSDCACRKPNPGLFREISTRLKVPLRGIPVIGDSVEDIRAAQAVEASAILVRTGHGEGMLQSHHELANVRIFPDLAEAIDELITAQAMLALSATTPSGLRG